MARTCVEGRRKLYAYCAEHGVPHRNCGKLIVATNAQESELLASIKGRAEANGVEGMQLLSGNAATQLEPNLHCTAALLSPATGIVDSHSYMLALQGDAEECGAMLAFHSPVQQGRTTENGIEIDVGGDEPMSLRAKLVVNSAGLHAPKLARTIAGMPAD